MIIMHLFRIDKRYLDNVNVTSEIEDYFKEIGLLEQFMQYRDNYNLIKNYDICYIFRSVEQKLLEEIEESFLKLQFD